ncbi:hypothetical protein, conserved, partial [Eimeria tenella]
QTRVLLRQVLLICLDTVASGVLNRLNYSQQDKWVRWFALQQHRHTLAAAAVWQPPQQQQQQQQQHEGAEAAAAAATPAGNNTQLQQPRQPADEAQATSESLDQQQQQQQQQQQHECWAEVLPYLQLFWPFIEQQEAIGDLDICVVSLLLQQLHAVAAARPHTFVDYPLLSEAKRFKGVFAAAAAAAANQWSTAMDSSSSSSSSRGCDDENQPQWTLGGGSPLYD